MPLRSLRRFSRRLGIVGVHGDLVEERVDRLAQAREGPHRALEILVLDGGARFLTGRLEGHRERSFLGGARARSRSRSGASVEGAPVLLLLDAQDVGGTAIAGEQVLAVLGVEETAERFDAATTEKRQLCPRTSESRRHRVEEIVARALVAQLDPQPLVDEVQKAVVVLGQLRRVRRAFAKRAKIASTTK